MIFSEEDYTLVEKILLGDGHFNNLQREFIELFETRTIIAGPGAGKTTTLAAKIILLLKQLNKNNSKEGVCIITYTNVAVNEINNTLQKAGIGVLTHPHFIGTIHEFFNKFCLIPFFKKEYNNSSFFFAEDHPTDKKFYENYYSRNFPWMNEGVKSSIAQRTCESDLIFDSVTGKIDIENTGNWDEDKFLKHKSKMLDAKMARKKLGFLYYEDTFLFSKVFLRNSKYQDILRKRFKYIFIDEFQDTTMSGTELIKEIFNSNNVLQMIGDPYQTIMYDQQMPKVDEHSVFRLNLSNRFGSEISRHLNIIMPEANIQTPQEKRSFDPVILLYDDEKDIYPTYKLIIREYEEQNSTFKTCKKRDKVLVWNKNWTPKIKVGVAYSNKKLKNLETKNNLLKHLVSDFVCNRVRNPNENLSTLKEWISKHQKKMLLHAILLELLKMGISVERKRKLKDLINELLLEKGADTINLRSSLFKDIEDILSSPNVKVEVEDEGAEDIFTIHSVKGETLRSVLVVNFNGGPLTDILFHRYGVIKERNYRYTDHNLLYVAMSRVTHLFVFALHQKLWSKEVQSTFQENWTVKDTGLIKI
ncbi:UvrD-helicase domain-containing protein [Paenibacillus macerans]|uniref:UvrD-helicase domain-containing protein n=1 Tax=Paenibacillus macerans TaxID=44252 RepID=UPI0022DF9757|nr:UvrD-helicase domain-containing protein [Paenibacillus macerans]